MQKFYKKIKPDPKFNSILVAKFINQVMKNGNKSKAQKIVYSALNNFKDPVESLKQAIENVGPEMEITSRRIGGANYQIPKPVQDKRKTTLAMRWILEATRSKKGVPMHKKLQEEIKLAIEKQGEAMRKRQNVHKMAEANKAFAHFAY